MLEDNGYQPIEHDLRKSSRKRKPILLYSSSPPILSSTQLVKVTPGDTSTTSDDGHDADSKSVLSIEEKECVPISRKDCRKFFLKYTFEERLGDLHQFLKQTGHTRVPFKYPPNPSLGNWVASVRHNYKRRQNGLKLKMQLSLEQIEILSNMPGWVWCARNADCSSTVDSNQE